MIPLNDRQPDGLAALPPLYLDAANALPDFASPPAAFPARAAGRYRVVLIIENTKAPEGGRIAAG
ncbi:MAG: hypothetical protein WA376_16935 [Terrimicrobiaceae bacterium]